jgi:hypothetical protein
MMPPRGHPEDTRLCPLSSSQRGQPVAFSCYLHRWNNLVSSNQGQPLKQGKVQSLGCRYLYSPPKGIYRAPSQGRMGTLTPKSNALKAP